MKPEIAVSALVPMRDAAGTVAAALRSLLVQSHGLDQIVVINDGSTDSSAQVVAELARNNPRIELIQQEAAGLVCALNQGLERCRGDWILRMDADDLSHHTRLENQLELASQDPSLDVIGTGVTIFPRRQLAEGFALYEDWVNSLNSHEEIAREAFVESPIVHPSVLVKRTVLVEAGGWRDLDWAEDYDLWMRLLASGARFGKSRKRLLFWRDGPSRLTRVDDRYSRAAFIRAKAQFLATGPLASAERIIVWGAGRIGGQLARLLEEDHGLSIEAFVDIDPRKIGNTRRGHPVLSRDELSARLGSGLIVIAAVGRRGARLLIRDELRSLGLSEGTDFILTA